MHGAGVTRSESKTEHVVAIQDLRWGECVAAMKLTDGFSDVEAFRQAVAKHVFSQPSMQTRQRHISSLIKWFLTPSDARRTSEPSFLVPCVSVWKAFHDEAALEQVMRWQYITSNALVAGFVDGPLQGISPGQPVDEQVDGFLLQRDALFNSKTRKRVRFNLRQVGLLLAQNSRIYRISPAVSPKAVAVLLTHLFAPEPRVLPFHSVAADPWWRRLGIVDEAELREKLRETARAGLIVRFVQMDTLDQATTRYSIADFQNGKINTRT